jgi:glyoxalase superfamily protein
MSRELPDRPNLEFLKKQAKALLRDLQEQQPEAQLADAQHAVAREYGFSSWPALHAHVEQRIARTEKNPFAGTWRWTADSAAAADPYRSVTLRFDVGDDAITIADVTIAASGEELRNENTLRPDGQTYPQPHGYAVMAKWNGPRVLEAVGTKDGQIEGRVTYEVSEDGTALTLSTARQVLRFARGPA